MLNTMLTYKDLRKRALIFDFVAIAVAAAVLYVGQSFDVPVWVPVLGVVIAVAALVLALKFSFAAHKLSREEYEKFRRASQHQQQQVKNEEDSDV